jgi:Protein of unknown function (DUF1566)
MIATELLGSAGLVLCLAGGLVFGPRCARAVNRAPKPSCANTAECIPGVCDPLCIDVGRYAFTREIVDDKSDGHRRWQRRVEARLSQPDADRYCAELSLEGLGGWRLPAPDELAGIRYEPGGLFGGGRNRHYCIPSIDQAAFPETPASLFWTSRVGSDDTAWYVGFDDGRSHRDVRSDELWVRCVHDAPLAPP